METTFLVIFTLLFLFFQTYGASSSNIMITASSNVTCIQRERQSLLVFRQGLTDESNRLSTWTGVECCEWQGVGCDRRNGHVVKLDLRSPLSFIDSYTLNTSNWLEGKVSPSLLNLKHLRYLDLSTNKFSGQNIPEFFGCFKYLEYLNLSYSGFSGVVPPHLGNLSRLQYLDLEGNMFSGPIPPSLGGLSSLRLLDFSFNQLSGNIPTSLGQLSNLQSLSLSGNELSGSIPESIGQLSMLENINLHDNQLSGSIPESIGQLTGLESLILYSNQLSGNIPSSLGQLSNLQQFDVSKNSLDGVVSEIHFTKLNNLTELDLSDNSLTLNVSPHWIPPFRLKVFVASSCNIGPNFPNWLQTQTDLEGLSLSNSSIRDIIPEWFQNISTHIQQLDLSHNQIGGRLPTMIPHPGLDIVNFGKNRFTGSVPIHLCELLSIKLLDLSYNNFSGVLPKCLGNLSQLHVMDLTDNTITGDVPNSLGSLSYLHSLHLYNNKFEGNLPMALQNLTRLVIFDLGNNLLTGNIPSWIGEQLWKLRILNLQSNRFTGKIPMQLCQNNALQHLNLANNSITGTIPRCFCELTGMINDFRDVDISYDYGEIGYNNIRYYYEENIVACIKGIQWKYTTTLSFLISLDLSNNNFIGEIPNDLMNLMALNNLNLSRNLLSGMIPLAVGNLKKIESLDLSLNKLFGRIPSGLASLTFLSYLNLSFNKLSGTIPVGNQLQTFDDPTIYEGNNGLCGSPLPRSCKGNNLSYKNVGDYEGKDGSQGLSWFYSGMVSGFVVGFTGLIGSLHFIRIWKITYFEMIENVYAWLTISVLVTLARLRKLF